MILLQTELDKFFSALENAVISDANASNHISSLKPLSHEIDTLPWRYRVLGFIEAMLVTKKLSLSKYEYFFDMMFGQRVCDEKARSVDNKMFAIRVLTDSGSMSFDVTAMNYVDAYFQLTKRTDYRELITITEVEIYKGVVSNIDDSFNEPVKIFGKDELVHLDLQTRSIPLQNTASQ